MNRLAVWAMAFAATVGAATRMAEAQSGSEFLQMNAVVLFQGDSIADGGRARTGHDLQYTMGHDYAYHPGGAGGSKVSGAGCPVRESGD